MGAVQLLDIHGAKGGSDKPKTPTEAPDSLRSIALAKMLIAVGEGEFDGTPTAENIFLDNTPLQDAHPPTYTRQWNMEHWRQARLLRLSNLQGGGNNENILKPATARRYVKRCQAW